MLRTLEEFDHDLPVEICPYRYHLDIPQPEMVPDLAPIVLTGQDVHRFFEWVAQPDWRDEFEKNMVPTSADAKGYILLTVRLPLVTFREELCASGRQIQGDETRALMDRLRHNTRGWRAAEVDTIVIFGRLKLKIDLPRS